MRRRTLPALVLLTLILPHAAPAAPQAPPARVDRPEEIRVNLVVVDAVVRDGSGRPVRGLTRSDFQLRVDGVPIDTSRIESFEEVCEPLPDRPALAASQADAARPETTAAGAPRHIVIYADFAQLSLAGRNLSLRAMERAFAGELAPGERVMILAHGKGLRLVQDFTSDASLLRARLADLLADRTALESEVLEEASSLRDVASRLEPMLKEMAEPPTFAPGKAVGPAAKSLDTENDRPVQDPMFDPGLAPARSTAGIQMRSEAARARRSLNALARIMPAMAALRGRKALILLSDSLRMEPGIAFASLIKTTPEAEHLGLREELARLTREAQAAGLAIYTVHASGLAEAEAGPGDAGAAGTDQALPLRPATTAALHSALDMQSTLAIETGGRALQRTNDVGAILAEARLDLSCHYLLGYRADLNEDGRRHDLSLSLGPDPAGRSRAGLTVRHRPYYTDEALKDRQERALRSAMEVPALFRGIPLSAEAFPVAMEGGGSRVLILVSVPIESLTLFSRDASARQGRILLKGDVSRGADTVDCQLDRETSFTIERSERPDAAHPLSRLVQQAICVLPPGDYVLGLAVQDTASGLIGGLRVPLRVPSEAARGALDLGNPILWARDPSAHVIPLAGRSGSPPGPAESAYLPLAQRLLDKGQEAVLTALACPPRGAPVSEASPLRVRRQLRGESGAVVADFRPLVITDPPDPATGCYQVVSVLPAGALGSGHYSLEFRIAAPPTGSAVLERTVDIAVR